MQKMSKNNWNSFKIVPQGHHNCQLSIVNCQFGEAVKFQFVVPLRKTDPQYLIFCISYLISHILYLLSVGDFPCIFLPDMLKLFGEYTLRGEGLSCENAWGF